MTSFMDDPYFGVHLEVERPSGPLRGQTNATHWTNWKGVGNRVARFAEFPVVCMERLLTLLNRAGGTLGAKGAFSPSQILADPIPGALFSHLPPSLCIILNMHNQMEFCTDIMIIFRCQIRAKDFLKRVHSFKAAISVIILNCPRLSSGSSFVK